MNSLTVRMREQIARDQQSAAADCLSDALEKIDWTGYVTCTSRKEKPPKVLLREFATVVHGAKQALCPDDHIGVAAFTEGGATGDHIHLHALLRLPEFYLQHLVCLGAFLELQELRWNRNHGRSEWDRYDPSRGGTGYVAKQFGHPDTSFHITKDVRRDLRDQVFDIPTAA